MAALDGYRIVEGYELDRLMTRIQDVLEDKGVLTVEDYKREFMEARNADDVPNPDDFPQL